jgi:peptidoglycan/xylan/chitin deacetylase (PgdA/CDA1 family)
MSLQRSIKLLGLYAARSAGLFSLVRRTDWRRRSLLILCYHGLSVDREHEWRPGLFMTPEMFRGHMTALRNSGLQVLSLSEGTKAVREGTLREPSVVITFDDGFHDFRIAADILADSSFPSTVYLTTWYVDRLRPIFGLLCSYVLWNHAVRPRRGSSLVLSNEFGFSVPPRLESPADAEHAAARIVEFADRRGYSGDDKDRLAERLCEVAGFDYEQALRSRLLGLLNSGEVKALSSSGVDFQLHTHRHRVPLDEDLFRFEIATNRSVIEQITGKSPKHFCYPSGVSHPRFLPWLRDQNVETAVTCNLALASPGCEMLMLPRMLDAANVTSIEFEAWLSGFEPRMKGLK